MAYLCRVAVVSRRYQCVLIRLTSMKTSQRLDRSFTHVLCFTSSDWITNYSMSLLSSLTNFKISLCFLSSLIWLFVLHTNSYCKKDFYLNVIQVKITLEWMNEWMNEWMSAGFSELVSSSSLRVVGAERKRVREKNQTTLYCREKDS